jgi:hypothetical protein
MPLAKKAEIDEADSDSDGPPLSPGPFSYEKEKKPMASLRKQVETVILKQLTKALEGNSSLARYCCGGRVLTTLSAESSTVSKNLTVPVSPPIILRWDDPTDNDSPRRIRLPIAVGTTKGNPVAFSVIDNSRLIKACSPSGILPESQFSTNLDPHYLGILDVVAQTILPGLETSLLQGRPEHRGVSAQLTHLQVSTKYFPSTFSNGWIIVYAESRQIHSGPSNDVKMFLPPIPANNYLGILLVCLPNMHQGKVSFLVNRCRPIPYWQMDRRATRSLQQGAFDYFRLERC